jgi:hypothetical protein
MDKDRLFLLKPDFKDKDQGPFYCPSCALVEGVLSFYPRLRGQLAVRYIDFPRPRKAIVDEIGEDNQGCPVLILAQKPSAAYGGFAVKEYKGKYFISGEMDIRNYLAAAYNVGRPH